MVVSDGFGREREVRPQNKTKKERRSWKETKNECTSQYGIVILMLYTRLY